MLVLKMGLRFLSSHCTLTYHGFSCNMLKTTDELVLKFIPGFKIQIKIQIKLFFSLFIFFCMSERITTYYFFLLGKDGFENFIIFFLNWVNFSLSLTSEKQVDLPKKIILSAA